MVGMTYEIKCRIGKVQTCHAEKGKHDLASPDQSFILLRHVDNPVTSQQYNYEQKQWVTKLTAQPDPLLMVIINYNLL